MSCKEIENAKKTWVEGWEKRVLGPSGEYIFDARLIRKYGGLRWFDPDDNVEFTAHQNKMHFKKRHGNNRYLILGILDGFNLDYDENHESNVNLWEPWHMSDDFFEQVTLYYKDVSDVLCYSKEPDVCESDEE